MDLMGKIFGHREIETKDKVALHVSATLAGMLAVAAVVGGVFLIAHFAGGVGKFMNMMKHSWNNGAGVVPAWAVKTSYCVGAAGVGALAIGVPNGLMCRAVKQHNIQVNSLVVFTEVPDSDSEKPIVF